MIDKDLMIEAIKTILEENEKNAYNANIENEKNAYNAKMHKLNNYGHTNKFNPVLPLLAKNTEEKND